MTRLNGWLPEHDEAVIEWAQKIADDKDLLPIIQKLRPHTTEKALQQHRLGLGLKRAKGKGGDKRARLVPMEERSCTGCGRQFHPSHKNNRLCQGCRAKIKKRAA